VLARLSIVILLATPLGASAAAGERPDWAFFVPSPEPVRLVTPRGTGSMWSAPGSRRTYTIAELQNVLAPPDWYPDEHPPMPAVVARGSSGPGQGAPLLPCALCHLPNGAGHAESASLAGLPADYIKRQFADWRSGARRIAVGDANAVAFLTALKKRYSSRQIEQAARYFASLRPRVWIRVVETDRAPAAAVDRQTLMRLPVSGGGTEPLGVRIVELPEDPLRFVYRDSHSGLVALVPKGSIAAGKVLVNQAASPGIPPCTTCHGERLTGLASAPPLAGRPPTYIVRQLWAFQHGDRAAESAAPMRVVAANLTVAQMVSIAAYIATRAPE
jgi:cytochrome c553